MKKKKHGGRPRWGNIPSIKLNLNLYPELVLYTAVESCFIHRMLRMRRC